MFDIKQIPTKKLIADRQTFLLGIVMAQLAYQWGIDFIPDVGDTYQAIRDNWRAVKMIHKELARRELKLDKPENGCILRGTVEQLDSSTPHKLAT